MAKTFYGFLRDHERKWLDKTFPGIRPLYPLGGGDKILKRKLLEALGAKVPLLLAQNLRLKKLLPTLDSFGEGFVKPHSLWEAKGAVGLVKEGDVYRNFTTGQCMTADEWIAWFMQQIRKHKDQWLIEEIIRGRQEWSIPNDVKFFCFKGEIDQIIIVKRDWNESYQAKIRWLDSNWKDLDTDKILNDKGKLFSDSIALPPLSMQKALAEEAKRISALTLVPFIRVDLFQIDPPVASELTKTPGTAWLHYWTNEAKIEVSRRWIRKWEEKKEELEKGAKDCLNPPFESETRRLYDLHKSLLK